MKEILLCASLCFLLVGCDSAQSLPPKPEIRNNFNNTLHLHQILVEQFNTAEVFAVPATSVYVVRDTNGAIWCVNVAPDTNAGLALIFKPTVTNATLAAPGARYAPDETQIIGGMVQMMAMLTQQRQAAINTERTNTAYINAFTSALHRLTNSPLLEDTNK